jgi:N-acetylglucosamine-6-phosphate deacetylase
VALVSNNIFACGLPDGVYTREGRVVVVEGGVARLADTQGRVLAGGTVGMERAFGNLMQFAGVSVEEASEMASAVPARVIGADHQAGHIQVGFDADLVVLDHDGSVWMTIIGGRVAYSTEE